MITPSAFQLAGFVALVALLLFVTSRIYAFIVSWHEAHKPVEERVETILADARQVQLDIDDLVCGRRPRHG